MLCLSAAALFTGLTYFVESATFAAGILLGSGLWTLLITVSTPTVTWLVVAASFGQWLRCSYGVFRRE